MSTAGVYLIKSGDIYYIGSSADFRRRKADHAWRLKANTHSNHKIQQAFNQTRSITFTPIAFIPKIQGESTQDHRNRLRAAEQIKLTECFNDPNNANTSPNASGPNNGHLMRERWKDPDYRKYMRDIHKSKTISAETREKMAKAKRGSNNHAAKPVIVTNPDGSQTKFPTVTHAAAFFNVKQQVLDLWIRKIVKWPGTGKQCRDKYRWIAQYRAEFDPIK